VRWTRSRAATRPDPETALRRRLFSRLASPGARVRWLRSDGRDGSEAQQRRQLKEELHCERFRLTRLLDIAIDASNRWYNIRESWRKERSLGPYEFHWGLMGIYTWPICRILYPRHCLSMYYFLDKTP
jgi:hypothetical protein